MNFTPPATKKPMNQILRGLARLSYYWKGACHQMRSVESCGRKTEALLQQLANRPDRDELEKRARYYNKLTEKFSPTGPQTQEIPFKRSRYFFDFMEHARGFPQTRRFDPLFGDITIVPDRPRIVKSRPIGCGNANSVLLPLDKFRHFSSQPDPTPFHQKKPFAVWRGSLNSQERKELIAKHGNNTLHDIGYTMGTSNIVAAKDFLTPLQQISHMFLLSVEGIDVATNLKWMMGTNCLILSPPLRFESWYMEGALQAGIHFVELKPDFSDLNETVEYYLENPDAAEEIIRNAQTWRAKFTDPNIEAMVAARVLQIYLEMSDQN